MSFSVSGFSSQISNSIFSRLDTKNQGFIEKSDLNKALDGLSESDSDALMESLDTDSDGKVTKTELSENIDQLLSQLKSNMTQNQGGMPPPPSGDRPPPPPPQGNDEGFTKDQLTEMASSTDDSKMAETMSKIAENFDAADTNQDGKVTGEEARAYQDKQEESDSTSTISTTSNQNVALKKLAALIQTYGLSENRSYTVSTES